MYPKTKRNKGSLYFFYKIDPDNAFITHELQNALIAKICCSEFTEVH